VEELCDKIRWVNEDGDYEKREELLEKLDEARANLETLNGRGHRIEMLRCRNDRCSLSSGKPYNCGYK